VTHDRGQSVVVGIVLLFGLVAVTSASIFVVAGPTLDIAEGQAESERVESAFTQLSQEIGATTYATDTSGSGSFESGGDGVIRKDGQGEVRISAGNEQLEPIELGAIVYEGDTQQTVAYQAGGVWRGSGTETQMVSAPPVHYQGQTLTLPVTAISGDETLDTGSVAMRHAGATTFDELEIVEGETVTIEIESEYYMGWAAYFETQTNDAAIDDIDESEETVTIKLGGGEVDESFLEYAAYASDEVSDQVGDEKEDGADLTSNTDQIEQIRDQTETHENTEHLSDLSGESLDAGTYFVSDDTKLDSNGDEVSVDLRSGDVSLVLDGDLSLDGEDIAITSGSESSNAFRIYTTESIALRNAQIGDSDPTNTQIYGTSSTKVWLGQGSNTEISGSIYAPRSESDVDNSGNSAASSFAGNHFNQCDDDSDICSAAGSSQISGAVTAGKVQADQAGSIEHDPDVEDSDLSLQPEGAVFPPDITYLNIVEHEIEVTNR